MLYWSHRLCCLASNLAALAAIAALVASHFDPARVPR